MTRRKSKRTRATGPRRRIVEDVFVGDRPAVKLECGHVLPDLGSHHRCRNCPGCARERSRRLTQSILNDDTPLMRAIRRAEGIPDPPTKTKKKAA